MILIADSGSTKTDWVLVDKNANRSSYSTIGYNPYFINSETVYNSISEKLVPLLSSGSVKKVIFYGAGCSTTANINIINRALSRCFINAEVMVDHDILAAARALLGTGRGFAAVLGTGSNTCIYDGKTIEKNIDSLGYLLGDEGSGSNIAKKIIRDYMRSSMPLDLHHKFVQAYNLSSATILDNLYNKMAPNRFLAGFCKFAHENNESGYIKAIVRESFDEFFKNIVSLYPEYRNYSFNCVGSVGFSFKELLQEVCESYRMKFGTVISSPIDNLVSYHLAEAK
ncbi:MAG: N-acetylglucosamine kinase [Bacteroidia bacterium]